MKLLLMLKLVDVVIYLILLRYIQLFINILIIIQIILLNNNTYQTIWLVRNIINLKIHHKMKEYLNK